MVPRFYNRFCFAEEERRTASGKMEKRKLEFEAGIQAMAVNLV